MNDRNRPPRINKGRRRKPDPLEVRLTLRYRFGDEPDDTVTMMDDLPVPMVDSVFRSRDRILRAFAATLVKAGLSRPKVVSELIPGIGLLRLMKGKPSARSKSRRDKKRTRR